MKLLGAAILVIRVAAGATPIVVDYPQEGSIFPPEITAPKFLWRDSAGTARVWRIDVSFSDGAPGIHANSSGERNRVGEIDPRCVSETNQLPGLTPEQAAERTWTPDSAFWAQVKTRSVAGPARITITGFRDKKFRYPVSSGQVTIRTSKDPVGAPIFYRDVPLMPSELEKGVIKPLAAAAIPLISWRLRDVGQPRSRVVLEGMHTCANCHSFSDDGKTLGMDLDGPQNDKGLYAIAAVKPQMSIRDEDLITWKSFREQPSGPMRVGFMSRVSPDGRYVMTTVGVDQDLSRNYYVANFKDYRFLQVFYATRGVLAWYDRTTGRRQSLPGADDPRFVQTNAAWSPDGKYLVFARAEGKDAYPEGRKMAEYANDPNETPVQYDLYRIPFNEGLGGRPEPIAGASRNGMSNSFPRVSPDGRWIVFVQARNGLLMRPDSQLYVVPAGGGQARRMQCNTPLMNSWHSFSPNGRWLVFSSKSRSPYTQMYLTHLDEEGRDSPAILVENSTAANRAVNLPEFVNIPPDGLAKIDVPAAEFFARSDRAWELAQSGQTAKAIEAWNQALELNPEDSRAQNNLAFALAKAGRLDEAIAHWRKALEANDEYPEVHANLARALLSKGNAAEAVAHWRKVLEIGPEDGGTQGNLGVALLRQGNIEEAVRHLQRAAELNPRDAEAHYNFGLGLLRKAQFHEAIVEFQKALELDPRNAQTHNDLGAALSQQGRLNEATVHFQTAIRIDRDLPRVHANLGNVLYLQGRISEALAEWRRSLVAEPDDATVLNRIAWVLATNSVSSVRNGAEALKLAGKAVELSGGTEAAMLDSLAAAYAECGRFPEAAATARRALVLATERRNQPLAQALNARIALYEGHTAFRETGNLQ